MLLVISAKWNVGLRGLFLGRGKQLTARQGKVTSYQRKIVFTSIYHRVLSG